MFASRRDEMDMSATGWISFSDVFLLTSVVLLVVSLAAARVIHSRDNWIAMQDQQKAEQTQRIEALAGERDRLNAAVHLLELNRKQLEAQATQLQIQITAAQEAAKTASALSAAAKAELAALTTELEKVRGAWQEYSQREGQMRQELIGLKGSLDRVVFVFDRSGSMGEGGRWEYIRATARTWVELLPVKHCALIVFNDDVTVYPPDGTLKSITTPADRAEFMEALSKYMPEGRTNTYEALKRAYAYGPTDAIIVFSDGKPTVGPTSNLTNRYLPVHKLVEAQKVAGNRTRIHTIALGDYFGEDYGRFLLGLAMETEGTFLGR
jgi:hypothetical protein